jgi:hypothetical protein
MAFIWSLACVVLLQSTHGLVCHSNRCDRYCSSVWCDKLQSGMQDKNNGRPKFYSACIVIQSFHVHSLSMILYNNRTIIFEILPHAGWVAVHVYHCLKFSV